MASWPQPYYAIPGLTYQNSNFRKWKINYHWFRPNHVGWLQQASHPASHCQFGWRPGTVAAIRGLQRSSHLGHPFSRRRERKARMDVLDGASHFCCSRLTAWPHARRSPLASFPTSSATAKLAAPLETQVFYEGRQLAGSSQTPIWLLDLAGHRWRQPNHVHFNHNHRTLYRTRLGFSLLLLLFSERQD